MTEKMKMHRTFELTEQLIEMETKKQFLIQKIEEYKNRINVLDGFIVYVREQLKEASDSK